jgi:hypothetical protein
MLIIDASPPRLWTPADLPNGTLSLWLDAADSSTITVVAGGVSEWREKSGFNRHATAATRRPNVTIVNGLDVINFTASGATRLDTPNFTIAPTRQFCTFAVVSGAGLLGGSTFRRIWVTKNNGDSSSPGSTYPQGYFGSGANAGTAMQIAGGSGITAPIVTGLGTGPQLLTGAFGTAGLAANENSISANGGAQSVLTGQTGALSTTGIRIGSDVNTSITNSWNSWIGEIIMTLALLFPQVQAIEGYLAWKWGLVANLPTAHPFKNRPPLITDV